MKLISSSKTDTCLSLKFKYSSEHERALSCIVNSILSTKCFVVSLSAQEVSFNLEGDYFVLPLEVGTVVLNIFLYNVLPFQVPITVSEVL